MLVKLYWFRTSQVPGRRGRVNHADPVTEPWTANDPHGRVTGHADLSWSNQPSYRPARISFPRQQLYTSDGSAGAKHDSGPIMPMWLHKCGDILREL